MPGEVRVREEEQDAALALAAATSREASPQAQNPTSNNKKKKSTLSSDLDTKLAHLKTLANSGMPGKPGAAPCWFSTAMLKAISATEHAPLARFIKEHDGRLPYGNADSLKNGHDGPAVYDSFDAFATIPATVVGATRCRKLIHHADYVLAIDRSNTGASTILVCFGVPPDVPSGRDNQPARPKPRATLGRVFSMKVPPEATDGKNKYVAAATIAGLDLDVEKDISTNVVYFYGPTPWIDALSKDNVCDEIKRRDFKNTTSEATSYSTLRAVCVASKKDTFKKKYAALQWMEHKHLIDHASFSRQLVIDFDFGLSADAMHKTMLSIRNDLNVETSILSFRGRVLLPDESNVDAAMDHIKKLPGVKFVNRPRSTLPGPRERDDGETEDQDFGPSDENFATDTTLIVLPNTAAGLAKSWVTSLAKKEVQVTTQMPQRKNGKTTMKEVPVKIKIGEVLSHNEHFALIKVENKQARAMVADKIFGMSDAHPEGLMRVTHYLDFLKYQEAMNRAREESLARWARGEGNNEANDDDEEEEEEESASSEADSDTP